MNLGKKWLIFFGSFGLFGLLSFQLPYFDIGQDIAGLIVSVTGILFGLVSSFFISEVWGKYTSIRKLSGQFKGYLLMLIDSVKFLDGNEEFKKEFEKEMEKYLIAYHIVPWDSVEVEGRYFQNFIDTIDMIEIESDTDPNSYLKVLTTTTQVRKLRNEMINVGKAGLMTMEWVTIIILTGVFISALFVLRDGSIILNVLATVLPSVAVLMLLFLDELDGLKWNSSHISFEPGEAALESIGKTRFYDTKFLDSGLLEPPTEDYRTEEDLDGKLREVYDEINNKINSS